MAAAEALVVTAEKQVHLALKGDGDMDALILSAQTTARNLMTEGKFDITKAGDRTEIERLGRRVARTGKEVDDCGIAYLRSAKASIKLVEDRKKKFKEGMVELRTEIEVDVAKWKEDHAEVKADLERLMELKTGVTGVETFAQLQAMVFEVGDICKHTAPADMANKFANACTDAVTFIGTAMDARKIIEDNEAVVETKRVIADKAKDDELTALKAQLAASRQPTLQPASAGVGPIVPPVVGGAGAVLPPIVPIEPLVCTKCAELTILSQNMRHIVAVANAETWVKDWETIDREMDRLAISE